MNIDLMKYIMKMIVVPMLLLSLVLIIHGNDDNISKRYITVAANNEDE